MNDGAAMELLPRRSVRLLLTYYALLRQMSPSLKSF